MKSVNQFCESIKRASERKDEANRSGNVIFRTFHPSERYVIDFADDFSAEGWEQYDTDQDAHYFGVWVNPAARKVLTYAEGDWSLVECADNGGYNAQIAGMNECYGEGRVCAVLDENGKTEVRQDRQRFFITGQPQEPQPTLADVLRATTIHSYAAIDARALDKLSGD